MLFEAFLIPRGGFGFVLIAYDSWPVEEKQRACEKLLLRPQETLGFGAMRVEATRGLTRRALVRIAEAVAENMALATT